LARRQRQLLAATWRLLAPGGTLLFTSCSVLEAENRGVVGAFLATTPEAHDVTATLTGGWPPRPSPGVGYAILPGEAGMDGFYYACLRKLS
jgi:16S rRNA (cytosine967-C5)-methyltransferase